MTADSAQRPAARVLLLVLNAKQVRQLQEHPSESTTIAAASVIVGIGLRDVAVAAANPSSSVEDHATVGAHHQGVLASIGTHHLLDFASDPVRMNYTT